MGHGLDGVLGDVVVFKRQGAAHAAAHAGVALQVFQVRQLVVFHLFQHADHVGDAVHRQAVLRADGVGLAVAGRPGDAVAGRQVKVRVRLHLLDVREQQAVHLHHGDGPVHLGLDLPDGPADGRHLGRAGGDEKAAHVLRRAAVLAAELPAGHGGGHLHRLADVHHVGQEAGEAHLNQPHDSRTGGRNQRGRVIALFHPLPDGLRHHVGPAGHLEHVVKAHLLEGFQHQLRLLEPAELAVQGRRGQGDGVFEALDRLQRVHHRHLGVKRADADTFPAVDTLFIDNMRSSVPDADGLRRAVLEAVGTAPASGDVQTHRMISVFQTSNPPDKKNS